MVAVTYRIDEKLKSELEQFCDAHGLKQQAVVQEALLAWLEDAKDLALIEERRDGPWVEWSDAKKAL